MGVRVSLVTEQSGRLTVSDGELVGESSAALTVQLVGELVRPPRNGMGVAIVAHVDEPVMVLGVIDGDPTDDGRVRLLRVKPRS